MKSFRPVLWIILIVIALLAAKFLFFPGVQDSPMGSHGVGGPPPPTAVEGYIVTSEPLDHSLQLTGTILPNEVVELRPEMSGKVELLPLREGAIIEKGTLLVKLNDKDLQAMLRKTVAQQKLTDARRSRLEQLLKMQGVSQQEYDEAMNQTEALSADADVLRVQIQRTEIRAPFRGMVGLKSISVGSYVTPNTIIAEIRQMDPVKIEFSVPGRYAASIKNGMGILFTVEGEKEARKGVVYALESGIDQNTRMLVIRAQAPNPSNSIRPGSFVKVELILEKIEKAILIPTQAIIPILKGQQVFVAKGGSAVPAIVSIGIREENKVQITEGINVGDTIVVTGVMSVRPGSALKFTNLK